MKRPLPFYPAISAILLGVALVLAGCANQSSSARANDTSKREMVNTGTGGGGGGGAVMGQRPIKSLP